MQGAGENGVPGGAGSVVAEAGVERGPAAVVLDEVDVDVVEEERQGEAEPEDAGGDFPDVAGGWGFGKRGGDGGDGVEREHGG